MNIWTLIACVILIIPTAFLFYAFIQSWIEREKRATVRLFVTLIFWVLTIASVLMFAGQPLRDILILIIAIIFLIVLLIVIIPWPEKALGWERGEPDQIDERNIMFSRAELIPGTKRYEEYYQEFPDNKKADDSFRKLAGLLLPGSSFYNPWVFGAADAAFFTVKSLHDRTSGSVSSKKQEFETQHITRFITNWAKELGCHSIGVTPLKTHHLYKQGGRKHNYGEEVKNSHSYAIAFSVEMDFQRVRSAPRGPIIMESSAQYLNSGTIAVQIAAFIRTLGYDAQAHIDGKYQVRCPEVAKDAGLGVLGRMSLLMTPKLGPRVRLGVVTTDLPLDIARPQMDSAALKFCLMCKKCAKTCPSQAISSKDPEKIGGATQWVINQEACFTYWCKIGTDCGRCIAVCPYSHPDNLLHNSIRFLIKTSPIFRRLAVLMDDWLYGKKPIEKDLPEWMIP